MKKLFFIPLISMVLWSCQKETMDPTTEMASNEKPIELVEFNLNDASLNKGTLASPGGTLTGSIKMLSFATLTQFQSTLNSLNQQVENHNDLFVKQNSSLKGDQLDDFADKSNFDFEKPLADFEVKNGMSQNTLRYEFNQRLDDFINKKSSVDPYDVNSYPAVLNTLLNQEGEVKIGTTIVSMKVDQPTYLISGDYANSLNTIRKSPPTQNTKYITVLGSTMGTSRPGTCQQNIHRTRKVNYGGNYRVRFFAGFRSLGSIGAISYSSIIHFRKKKKWFFTYYWPAHGNIGQKLTTKAFDNNCSSIKQTTSFYQPPLWRIMRFGSSVLIPGQLRAKSGQSLLANYYYNGNSYYWPVSW